MEKTAYIMFFIAAILIGLVWDEHVRKKMGNTESSGTSNKVLLLVGTLFLVLGGLILKAA